MWQSWQCSFGILKMSEKMLCDKCGEMREDVWFCRKVYSQIEGDFEEFNECLECGDKGVSMQVTITRKDNSE